MTDSSRIPQHRIIYELLRRQIEEKKFLPGDLLPSENELCAVHRLARPTVRKALDRLLSDGFIKKQQGKGSIVCGIPQGAGILSLHGTTTAIGENLITRIITRPERRNLKDAFGFETTSIEREAGCLYFERLRLVNNRPVFFDITKLPDVGFKGFASLNLENKSLFDILRQHYQLEITGGEQRLFAIKAENELCTHLDVRKGHPILQLDRKIETNRPQVHLYSQLYCNTQQYALFGTF